MVWSKAPGQPRETVLWQLGVEGLSLACSGWATAAQAFEEAGLLGDAIACCDNCMAYAPRAVVEGARGAGSAS